MDPKQRSFVLVGIFFGAVALVFVGQQLELNVPTGLGLGILGVGLVMAGLDAVRQRRTEIAVEPGNLRSSSRFRFRGPGAVFWGLMFMTLGLMAVAGAIVMVFGLGDAADRLIRARPGIVIAPAGFLFLCTAVGWLSGSEEMNSSLLMFLATLPQRIGVVITLLFALAVLGVGLFELAAPADFDRIFEGLKPPPHPEIPVDER